MPFRPVVFAFLACSCAFLAGGCGGPGKGTITGEVTIDGKPVEKGTIMFSPSQGAGEPFTANIINGKYEAVMTAGPKRVQVSAPVVTGKRKENPGAKAAMIDITSESLPPKYNTKSELSFDIQPGANKKDWTLVVKRVQ